MSKVACQIAEPFEETPVEVLGNCSVDAEKFPAHVLVVDDEPLIRWSVAESLGDQGFDVEQASDALSALKMITNAVLPFDVVITDLRLPDMHDLSLLGTIRQVMPRAHVILMTAFGNPEIAADAKAMGVDVLAKPFEFRELQRLIRRDRRNRN